MLLYVIGGVAGLITWQAILRRWQSALPLLLIFLPFTGVIVLLSGQNPATLVAKDILIVVPAYLSFFILRPAALRRASVPPLLSILFTLLAVLVLLQTLNSGVANLLMAAIGVKVWLFYIPLIYLASAACESEADLVRLLRVMAVVGPVPCLVGLAQWYGAEVFGYVETMTAFYGDAAYGATQNFSQFNIGGTIRRLPATFTNAASYAMFTLAMLSVSYGLIRMDPSPKWRMFGRLLFVLAFAATLLSGQRSAFLLAPVLVGLIVVLDRRIAGALLHIVTVPVLLVSIVLAAGFNVSELATGLPDPGDRIGAFAYTQITRELQISPFGMGTGTNTGPARYAVEGAAPSVLAARGFNEVYFAKAVHELGAVGLLLIVAIFGVIFAAAWRARGRILDQRNRSLHAAFFAYLLLIMLLSFGGWPLDVDPANVYFWIFLGVVLRLPHIVTNRHLEAAGPRPTPTRGPRPATLA